MSAVESNLSLVFIPLPQTWIDYEMSLHNQSRSEVME